MKKLLLSISFLAFSISGFTQDARPIRAKSLGLSFLLFDYKTVEDIKNTSLSSVRANDRWTKLGQQSPGVGLHYFQGLSPNIDFAGTFAATFVRYPVGSGGRPSGDRFLMEVDASAQFKLLNDSYFATPYLNVGAGVSMYGVYWGAFMPLGAGLNLNLTDETTILLNFQYRHPVTKQTAAGHFVTGIGVTGLLSSGN